MPPAAPPPSVRPARTPDAAPPACSWGEILDRVTPRLRALLAGVEAGPLDADPVVLHAPPRVVPLIEPQRDAVERLIREATGRRARVEVRERADATTDTDHPVATPEVRVTDHPLVRAALDVFEGSVGRVMPKRSRDS